MANHHLWAACSLLACFVLSCEPSRQVGDAPDQSTSSHSTHLEVALSGEEDVLAPPSLSDSQIEADVSSLTFALERGWGGFGEVEQEVQEQALGALEGPGKTDTPQALCRHIEHALDILPDAHFGVTLAQGKPCAASREPRGSVGAPIACESEA